MVRSRIVSLAELLPSHRGLTPVTLVIHAHRARKLPQIFLDRRFLDRLWMGLRVGKLPYVAGLTHADELVRSLAILGQPPFGLIVLLPKAEREGVHLLLVLRGWIERILRHDGLREIGFGYIAVAAAQFTPLSRMPICVRPTPPHAEDHATFAQPRP
jgi:hypothetical protein